jgi:hypothetical protein
MNTMNLNPSIRCVAPLLFFLAACYTAHPLEAPLPQPATRIVAQVTDSGTVAMANAIGPGAQEVEAVVSTADSNTWNLSLVRVDHRGGFSVMWNKELVPFPRYALTGVTEKRFDKRKSWMAGGLIAAGAFAAAKLFHALGADENKDTGPIGQTNRVWGGGF